MNPHGFKSLHVIWKVYYRLCQDCKQINSFRLVEFSGEKSSLFGVTFATKLPTIEKKSSLHAIIDHNDIPCSSI